MIRAKTIMTENVVTVNEASSLKEAANLMLNKHVSTLIVARDGKPIAILTENDIVRGFTSKKAGKVNYSNPKPIRNEQQSCMWSSVWRILKKAR